MEKVWIFGDSYSSAEFKDPTAWPHKLAERYDINNFSISGTGPEYMIKLFKEQLNAPDLNINELKDINLIFFLSHDSRKDFSFLTNPSHQCITRHVDQFSRPEYKHYKKQKPFLEKFYIEYYDYNRLDDFDHLKYVGIIKEFSRFFKKVLIIPVFDRRTISILYNKFNSTIEDHRNCTYARGPILFDIEEEINTNAPNHYGPENHILMYEQLVNWIDNNIPFDSNNLKKLTKKK